MKILIAPDSFKGSLTAVQLCKIIGSGLHSRFPQHEIIELPMADGGEGTVDALVLASGGRYFSCPVLDPLGRKTTAEYGVLGDGQTTVIEMAAASGLPLLTRAERDPMGASSFGTGQIMLDAAARGCSKMIMGIGGSATNDGGAGMLMALGAGLFRKDGTPISGGCGGLSELARVDISTIDKRVAAMEITVACDVKNPLWGNNGATRVFAGQKGARADQLGVMDNTLRSYGEILQRGTGKNVAQIAGSGAAGGMGAGLLACLNARLEPGFEVICRAMDFESRLSGVALVITGEGQMNFQSVMGKLPVEVAKRAALRGIKTVAIVGAKGQGSAEAVGHFAAVHELVNGNITIEYSIKHSAELVRELIMRMEI